MRHYNVHIYVCVNEHVDRQPGARYENDNLRRAACALQFSPKPPQTTQLCVRLLRRLRELGKSTGILIA